VIDLENKHLELVKAILRRHLTHYEVYAFGSRVTNRARKYSDLDLVIRGERAIEWQTLENIKDDLSFSNLPILIDVMDWNKLSESFLAAITNELEKLPI